MRLGFVGVGPWAMKLKASFERQGGSVVAYDRRTATPAAGFGARMSWHAMLQNPEIHAVVAAADPDTVLTVGRTAAQHGKPVFLTKPVLLTTPLISTAPIVIDYVRLSAPAYLQLKQHVQQPHHIRIKMYGKGPYRDFPGAFDYGPHVTAFMCDLLGPAGPMDVRSWALVLDAKRELFLSQGTWNSVPFEFIIGNGAASAQRTLEVTCGSSTHEYIEERGNARYVRDGQVVQEHPHQDSIDAFVRQFIADVEARRLDLRWVMLSAISARVLNTIRAVAERDL